MNPPLDTEASVLKMTTMVLPDERTCVPVGTVPQNLSRRGAPGVKPLRIWMTQEV